MFKRQMFAASPAFLLLTVLAPVVVFRRLHDEWQVGPELPFPRRFRDSQLVNIILSYVHSELKLQRSRRFFHHRHNHHLRDRTRYSSYKRLTGQKSCTQHCMSLSFVFFSRARWEPPSTGHDQRWYTDN